MKARVSFLVILTTLAISVALVASASVRRFVTVTEQIDVKITFEALPTPVPSGVYKDKVVCNQSDSHCVYMNKNAWLLGDYQPYGHADPCKKVEYDDDGYAYGEDACQFPDYSVTRVFCENGYAADVWFQNGYSNFTTYGDAKALWSSKKRTYDYDDPAYYGTWTEEAGDDIYVYCS